MSSPTLAPPQQEEESLSSLLQQIEMMKSSTTPTKRKIGILKERNHNIAQDAQTHLSADQLPSKSEKKLSFAEELDKENFPSPLSDRSVSSVSSLPDQQSFSGSIELLALQRELKASRKAYKVLEKSYRTLKETSKRMKMEYNAQKKLRTQFEEENDLLKTEVDVIKKEKLSIESTISNEWSSKLSDLETEKNKLIDQLQLDLNTEKQANMDMKTQCDQLIQEKEATIESLQADVTSLKQSIEDTVSEHQTKLTEMLQQTSESYRIRCEELIHQTKEETMHSIVPPLRSQLEEKQQLIDSLQMELETSRKQNKEQAERIRELELLANKTYKEMLAYSTKQSESDATMNGLIELYKYAAELRENEFLATSDKYSQTIQELNQSLEEREEQMAQMVHSFEQSRNEFLTMKTKIEECSIVNVEERDELETYRNEVSELQNITDQLSQNFNALDERYQQLQTEHKNQELEFQSLLRLDERESENMSKYFQELHEEQQSTHQMREEELLHTIKQYERQQQVSDKKQNQLKKELDLFSQRDQELIFRTQAMSVEILNLTNSKKTLDKHLRIIAESVDQINELMNTIRQSHSQKKTLPECIFAINEQIVEVRDSCHAGDYQYIIQEYANRCITANELIVDSVTKMEQKQQQFLNHFSRIAAKQQQKVSRPKSKSFWKKK